MRDRRPSRRPRHRRGGRARLGPVAAGARATGRAVAVLAVAAVLATGAGPAVTTADGRAPAATASARAGPGAADAARRDAESAVYAERTVAETRAVAGAALQAATGADPLRIAPEPPPGLADLDAAVARLRTGADHLGAAAGGTAGERVAAAAEVRAGAAEVFRLALLVERAVPPVTATSARDLDVAGLAAVEQAATGALTTARLLASGPAPGGASRTSGAVRSGTLRSDGTIDPGLLCPVPFAPGARLRCDAVDALVRLNADFRAEHGTDLPVGDTYRTFAAQVAVKAAKGGLAATPGSSHHGWGVAVDFRGFGGVGEFDSPLYLWMREHAPAHGWVHPAAMGPGGSGPLEPWHWEFAGVPAVGGLTAPDLARTALPDPAAVP